MNAHASLSRPPVGVGARACVGIGGECGARNYDIVGSPLSWPHDAPLGGPWTNRVVVGHSRRGVGGSNRWGRLPMPALYVEWVNVRVSPWGHPRSGGLGGGRPTPRG